MQLNSTVYYYYLHASEKLHAVKYGIASSVHYAPAITTDASALNASLYYKHINEDLHVQWNLNYPDPLTDSTNIAILVVNIIIIYKMAGKMLLWVQESWKGIVIHMFSSDFDYPTDFHSLDTVAKGVQIITVPL